MCEMLSCLVISEFVCLLVCLCVVCFEKQCCSRTRRRTFWGFIARKRFMPMVLIRHETESSYTYNIHMDQIVCIHAHIPFLNGMSIKSFGSPQSKSSLLDYSPISLCDVSKPHALHTPAIPRPRRLMHHELCLRDKRGLRYPLPLL
jgi:hypothetical protein